MLFPTSPSIERPINQRQQVRLKLRYKKRRALSLSLSFSLARVFEKAENEIFWNPTEFPLAQAPSVKFQQQQQ